MTRIGTLFLVVATLSGLTGCRVFNKGSDTASNNRDPLYGRYIPKTDLPIPGRDSAGKGRDPLYAAPASTTKNSASNSEPFRNSRATTTAGLASNVKVEESGMSLGDRRPPAEPATRGTPLRPSREGESHGDSWERVAEELGRLRARYDAPIREPNGDYSIRASVPTGPNGAMRQYEAVGPSAAAAAKQLLEQIQADRPS